MSLIKLAMFIVASVYSSAGLQLTLDPRTDNVIYPTCQEACSAKGCECKACGIGQAFKCSGCCCFCPSKPQCPQTEEKMTKTNCYEGPWQMRGPENGWEMLNDIFQKDVVLSQDTCQSSEYNEYLSSLPPLSLSSLRIPPNTRILQYGCSYLGQIFQNILAANEDILIKNGPLGGTEGDVLFHEKENHFDGYVVKWDFTVNSTIVQVQNYKPFQFGTDTDKLKEFMQKQHFDIAFFMNPHPRCLFDPCNGQKSGFCDCICDHAHLAHPGMHDFFCAQNFEGSFRGERSDVSPLWDVIQEAMQGKHLYEVEAWSHEPRTWFHADAEHIIRSYPILNSTRACNEDDSCSNPDLVTGHQCQPGNLAKISERVVAKMNEVYGG